MVTPLCLCPR